MRPVLPNLLYFIAVLLLLPTKILAPANFRCITAASVSITGEIMWHRDTLHCGMSERYFG
jgi:hypothetical protein